MVKKSQLKFKKIIVMRNGKNFGTPRRNTWLKCYESSLVYLSWSVGRLYFFADKLKEQKSSVNILDLKCKDNDQSIFFNYVGDWEEENPEYHIKKVNDQYQILFENANDYKKAKTKILQFC